MGIPLRAALACLAMIVAATLVPTAASAQVDCGNGNYCPQGTACLLDGLCGRLVEALPGSTKASNGQWCLPGFREHQYRPGTCSPMTYSDCRDGTICPSGKTCGNNSCDGGGAPTGPMCNGARCDEGRICSSAGRCINTAYFFDCGNGSICTKGMVCGAPNGCAIVDSMRTRQIPKNR